MRVYLVFLTPSVCLTGRYELKYYNAIHALSSEMNVVAIVLLYYLLCCMLYSLHTDIIVIIIAIFEIM